MSASYTYGPSGERISQTKSPGAPTEDTAYYGLNPHTDVETLTDQAGNATSTYRYTGYGSNDATGFTGKDKQTATGGPEVEPYNPYRFNSKRWDPATSSYDMGFRDYSPGLNRFLTRDMYNGAMGVSGRVSANEMMRSLSMECVGMGCRIHRKCRRG